MALHYDLSSCKDTDAVMSDKNWPITNTVILMSIGVGLSEISEDNLDEWTKRLALLQALSGPFLQLSKGDKLVGLYLTREHLEPLVGLTVNVSNESWNQFVERHVRYMGDTIRRQKHHNKEVLNDD